MKKLFFVLAAALAFGAAPAQAAVVKCPGTTLPDPDDFYMLLTTPAGITASCYDWGQTTQNGNGTPDFQNSNTVITNNLIVELPTSVSTTALQDSGGPGGVFSGFNSGGIVGQVTFLKNAVGPLYLYFKFGGGQTSPYFFVYALNGVNTNEAVSWSLNQTQVNAPFNGLSGIRVFGNVTSGNGGNNGGDVPEPTSMALIGLGLIGAGLARRRK